MQKTKIAGIGMYVPSNVVTNNDLLKYMDTSDEWIQERTGIKERRYADRTGETTTTMGVEAAKVAIERAGITAQDIDFIIFATLSPDYYFPGCGVLLQRAMKMKEVGALDVRNQCRRLQRHAKLLALLARHIAPRRHARALLHVTGADLCGWGGEGLAGVA